MFISADRGHVDHAGALRGGGAPNRFGPDRLYGFEALFAAFEQDADEVDDDARPAHCSCDRRGVAQVGLHRMDLTDPAERLQMAGEIGTADGHPNAEIFLGQRPHHVAAQEAGPAEHGYQGIDLVLYGHRPRRGWKQRLLRWICRLRAASRIQDRWAGV
jgi:hypothetical protein